MSRAPDFSPREAVERWLDKKRVTLADSTLQTYHYRTKQWVEWCEEQGIERVRDLTAWDVESFETARRGKDITPITLQKQLRTLRDHLRYLERVGLVEEELAETIEPPAVDRQEEVDDTRLHPDQARSVLEYWRTERPETRHGMFLDIAWVVGARMGAIRALDVEDVDLDRGRLRFIHRPTQDTPLKNSNDGERVVGIPEKTVEHLRVWLRERPRTQDEFGRDPLFATQVGRAALNTLRVSCYYATLPCHAVACPHDRSKASCDWSALREASPCPSSRSPHQVRTGSIIWQINQGIPKYVVAERANVSVDVLEKHYDHPDPDEAFTERRERYVSHLDFDHGTKER